MLTKAIIVDLSTDSYSVKVRIPRYDKLKGSMGSTPDSELYYASICTPPSYYPYYQIGDVVYVDFEDDNLSKPVILGCLYCKDKMLSLADIKVSNLSVSDTCSLSNKTSIGNEKFSKLLEDKTSISRKLIMLEERIEGEST